MEWKVCSFDHFNQCLLHLWIINIKGQFPIVFRKQFSQRNIFITCLPSPRATLRGSTSSGLLENKFDFSFFSSFFLESRSRGICWSPNHYVKIRLNVIGKTGYSKYFWKTRSPAKNPTSKTLQTAWRGGHKHWDPESLVHKVIVRFCVGEYF